MINYADFWWGKITGPKTVVDSVASGLENQEVVVISIPFDLPWRDVMRKKVQNFFDMEYSVSEYDIADDYKGETPGKFLLSKTNNRSVRLNYRSGSIQKYLIDNHVLTGKLVWIKGLQSSKAQEWVNFCKEYKKISPADCHFVIETYGDASSLNTRSDSIKTVIYENHVSPYDVQLFNGLVLNSLNTDSIEWNKYLSALYASLCKTDAEISSELLESDDFRTENPADALMRIADSAEYRLRGSEKDSDHILNYCRCNNQKEITHRIWSAQLQTLFPLIELERTDIIEACYDDIDEAIQREEICQFDVKIEKPEEVELGTLDYIVKRRMVRMPDETLRNRISFLHSCRNKIAHMNCLNPEEIVKLIEKSE